MADDTPTQNMTFMFQDYSNFTLNGPYVYISLNHFSGVSAASTADISFYGVLYYKKYPKGKYLWNYSYLVYKSFPDAIVDELLADYADWTQETLKTDVVFDENSTAIILSLPSLQDWDIIEKISPLVYHKNHLLKQNSIRSNMQFMLCWKGPGYPVMKLVALQLIGASQPVRVTFYTNSIEDNDKNDEHVAARVEKNLDPTNLEQVLSSLNKNNYDASTWHRLCLRLGLLENTLNAYEDNENNVNDRLRTCLHAWLQRADKVDDKGGATWTSLEKALKDIDQKAVAENMRKSRAHSEL
ncbi:PREDICTED: uncharacterized protein LOC109590893 [Amphimedon queenslandica]|nr:PREDICTED: uncharacterized protein LOC109590893 [Amphimedon queenslandica]|eukprot:XP_019862299.1 PREDICTED: uncharacterized protein LOC109590893 [Amphimedon queenslandica]